jgi:hypothetical protein
MGLRLGSLCVHTRRVVGEKRSLTRACLLWLGPVMSQMCRLAVPCERLWGKGLA